jgi:hypothetical protein
MSLPSLSVGWAVREAAARGCGLVIVHACESRYYGSWTTTRDLRAGPRLVAHLAASPHPRVTLTVVDGEPSQLLDAWDGTDLAFVVDAVRAEFE